MTFEIRWMETAFKKLQKLDRVAQERIVAKLKEAAADPFTIVQKLSGVKHYSIRFGDHRVIVSIEKGGVMDLVIDLGRRSKVYEKL